MHIQTQMVYTLTSNAMCVCFYCNWFQWRGVWLAQVKDAHGGQQKRFCFGRWESNSSTCVVMRCVHIFEICNLSSSLPFVRCPTPRVWTWRGQTRVLRGRPVSIVVQVKLVGGGKTSIACYRPSNGRLACSRFFLLLFEEIRMVCEAWFS